MKSYLISFLCAFFLSFVLLFCAIPLLKKLRFGQPILEYVKEHKDKSGTPTMGGIFFVIATTVIFFAFGGGKSRLATFSLFIGMAFAIVGFLDDFLKIKLAHNQGLKPYQKIIFQFIISALAGVFAYKNGLTVFYIPFVKQKVDFGVFTVFTVAFIFLAITNGVNLTDGLDGLAGSCSVAYLLSIAGLIYVETVAFGHLYSTVYEYKSLIGLCFVLSGAIVGFLIFNVSKASVFMGDSGSLSLGGFIGAISIFSSNSLFIPLLGITFVISTVSVIIQVMHYKRTKKRVFLMAPLHHHLQMKGLSESKITFLYFVITGIMGAISIIFYL